VNIVFFFLDHVMGECFIDDRLILVIFSKDEYGEFIVVVHEIFEREDDVVFGIIECIFGSKIIFPISCTGISKLVDKGGKLPFHIVPKHVFGQFAGSLDLHRGA
jgi:hypothetical protein